MLPIILSIFGIINAIYLTTIKAISIDACIIGTTCSNVINSSFSNVLGIPVSVFGIIFFSILLFTYIYERNSSKSFTKWTLCVTSSGSIASLWFLFAQAILIKSFCPFCILSSILVFTLFSISIMATIKNKAQIKNSPFLPPLTFLCICIILFITPLFLTLVLKEISRHYEISIKSTVFAKTSFKNFTLKEIKNNLGVEDLINQERVFKSRQHSLLHLLVVNEAKKLNLPINNYYKIFVEYGLDVKDKSIRNKIKSFNRNSISLTNYLNQFSKLSQPEAQQKYINLKNDLLELYEVEFPNQHSAKIDLKENPFGAITYGNENAPIEVVIFSDFLCSHCAISHHQLKGIITKNPNKFHVTYRQFPHVSKLSEDISKTAYCLGKQNLYIPFSDAIYSDQKNVSLTTISKYLPEGTDIEKLKTCTESQAVQKVLKADINEVNRLKIRVTPTIIVNGYLGDMDLIESKVKNFFK